MSSTTSYQDFKNAVRNLKTDPSFLPAPLRGRDTSVPTTIDLVLNRTFEDLKGMYRYCFAKTPYVIGMSYIHELAQMEADRTGSQILNVWLVSNLVEIRRQLKEDIEVSLSGLIFLSDGDCENTLIRQRLIRNGAKNVGWEPTISNDLTLHTTRGAPFFVANKKVLLAINSGTAPILKNSAEALRLFALSAMSTREHDVTLTMRLFQDIRKVVYELFGRIERPLAGIRSEMKKYEVAICLGFKTFQHDLLLHQLANKLNTHGHPIVYYFFDELLSAADVANIINHKTEWDIKTQDQAFEASTFPPDFSRNTKYQFILAPPNVVDYTPTSPFAEEPIFLSIPFPDKGFSIEITRRMGAHMHLIDFAQNVVPPQPNPTN